MSRQKVFDAFERVYESKLSGNKSRRDSFEEAASEFRTSAGFDPYKDHDSFMSARSRQRKKGR